jgi:hypothetical protein
MYRVANRLLEWAFDLADVLCVAVTGRATDEWDAAWRGLCPNCGQHECRNWCEHRA